MSNSSPTLHSLRRRDGQMRVRATRDDRNDPGRAELGTFLDGPLETIELEDGEDHRDLKLTGGFHFFRQFELDSIVANADDARSTQDSAGGHIELLPDTCAQDTRQVRRVLAGKCGAVGIEFVGNPAAAGHG